MPHDPDLLTLAQAVLRKQRDSAWDSRGTPPKNLSQSIPDDGTAKSASNQQDNPTVPLSQTLGRGTVGHPKIVGHCLGQSWDSTTEVCSPRCIQNARSWSKPTAGTRRSEMPISFLAKWGRQAEALGWTARELFGLHPVPAQPVPTFRRLARYDTTGLIWLLQGRPVIALTETDAAIQSAGADRDVPQTPQAGAGAAGRQPRRYGAGGMSNRPARITQVEIERAIRAAKKAGVTEVEVKIGDEASIRFPQPPTNPLKTPARSSFDARHAPPSPASSAPSGHPARQDGLVRPHWQRAARPYSRRVWHRRV